MKRESNWRAVACSIAAPAAIVAMVAFAGACSDRSTGAGDVLGPELSTTGGAAPKQSVLYVGATNQVVTPPAQHLRLGFTTGFPISGNRSGSAPCVSYAARIQNGAANLAVNMGANVSFSYDRADLKPGGNVPIQVTYTPTNDAGPELSVNAAGDVSMDVDIDDGCLVGLGVACGLGDVTACAVLAMAAAIDAFHGELDSFNLITATGDFTAPLGSDPPVVVPGTGSSADLKFLGSTLLRATPISSFTLAPTPTGSLPGLGGAVALLSVNGADLVSPIPLIPVLEWQAPVALQATIQIPATPGANATLTLSPTLHWLNTSASLAVKLHLLGVLGDVFSDPSDVSVFSGNLGAGLGLDTLICNGVPAAAQPACQTTVGAGNLPYPALLPQPPNALPAIPPLPGFASAQLSIVLDADNDGLLDGEEFAIGTNPDDADTDDDGLIDGPEVKTDHCNPLVVDTDSDGLTDAQEVNTYHTDCAKADTDGDGLNDGLEVTAGTNPLNPDTDGDGIPDGKDVEWLQNIISALPGSDFKSTGPGSKTAILSNLDAIEGLVAQGNISQAIKKLQDLRSRMDGCGAMPDSGDWIVDCAAQLQIRPLIDLYISNLSS